MRVLFWYCDQFAWTPTIKTLETVPESKPDVQKKVVVAFVHVEPKDVEKGSSAETKLVKNLFFAGEVLDIDAVTGGFNFQNAWTGGFIAGNAMAEK